MQITLVRADGNDQAINALKTMFRFFYNELSPYEPNLVINANGLATWAPAGVAESETEEGWWAINWWVRANGEHYLIRVDDTVAGFVNIVKAADPVAAGAEYDLFDFYILPKFRGKGVGKTAAKMAFDLHHGTWQVFYLTPNLPANRLWDGVVAEITDGQFERRGTDYDVELRFAN